MPLTVAERRQLADRLQASGLEYIAILFSGGGVLPAQHETPEQHLARLQTRFAEASSLNPRFVNLLAGNDRWPLAQQVDFLGKAHELAAGFGLTCSFETHRATSLYSPWLTTEIIQQLPSCALPPTSATGWWSASACWMTPAMTSAPLSTACITCRPAGYDQPQVPHPAAPEYQPALAFAERFWQQIWRSQRQRGYPQTTLTPEFGADGYLHHLPFTNVPVADLGRSTPDGHAPAGPLSAVLSLTEQEPQP